MEAEKEQERARWLEAIDAALEGGDAAAIEAIVAEREAAELADLLESLAPEQRRELWRHIAPPLRGDVLVEAHDEVRRQLIADSSDAELERAVARIDLDALSDIDEDLPPQVLDAVLASMDAQRRQRFETIRKYPDDTAGGLMDADAIAIRPDITLETAARFLRRHRAEHQRLPEHLDRLTVTDHDGRYVGELALADVLAQEPQRRVHELMERDREPIAATLPAAHVAQLFEDRNLVSAPVVDDDGRLLGRITVDDIVDVIREQAERSQLANTGLDEGVDTFAPALDAAKRRAVWLGINLVSALVAAWVISRFEGTIDRMVALAVLMPVVASMGGVAGTQSLALLIRAIALGQVHGANRWRLLRRELAVGSLNGLLWAAVVWLVAAVWFGNLALALVFGAGVVLNLLIGVAAGTGIPMLLDRLRIDPALAGGVVLVALTDALGFLVFLGLGTAFLM